MSHHPESYLADYVFFNSQNECPQAYHIWAGIFAAGTMLCRRVWLPFDQWDFYPNLYITLVGTQGTRKSVAKDIARDLVSKIYPTLPLSASVETRESICKFLGSPDAIRAYNDHEGHLVEHRPYTIFANELKNWLSVAPQQMVDFLTDIYDRKVYDVRTKNKGNDLIVNPCINFLACETTSWVLDRMKDQIITGGFSRRMLYVHYAGENRRIPFPCIPPGGREAWERVEATLKRMQTYSGPFTWDAEAKEWYANWYLNLKPPQVQLVIDFFQSMHVQVLKVAMILALADTGEKVITRRVLEAASSLVEQLIPGMTELGNALGGNRLLVPTLRALDSLKRHTVTFYGQTVFGIMREAEWRKALFASLTPLEVTGTIDHLLQSEQIKKVKLKNGNVESIYVAVPEALDEARAILAKSQTVVANPSGSSSALLTVPLPDVRSPD